ncbi:hypothetical protein RUND412_006909 [Rhizina undulata]
MASHGNYKGYQGVSRYEGFNLASHVVDLRIKLLAERFPSLFLGRNVLDIGCNNGAVAAHIALTYSPQTVTGVEIDGELVQKAKSHLSFRYSRTAPEGTAEEDLKGRDVTNYFPISSVMSHGHRPYPHAEDAFPRNVKFIHWDFASAEVPLEEGGFETVLALSVVKWIHLQNGDEGLKSFFRKVHATLAPHGHFVLEPQDWDSYKKAVKKNRPLKPSFETLTLTPSDFKRLIEETGFTLEGTIEDGLRRCIYVYKKR